MTRRLVWVFTVLSLFLSFNMEPTIASVILRMSFDQVVKGAELIVDGEVVSKEIRLSPISGRPFTYFNIAIIDLIKGDYPKKIIEIGYMGGQIGDMTLNVSNMRMPEIGERGIYFIETTNQQQIHPLIGWQQGHYRVIIDPNNGQERVVSEDENDRPARSRALSLPQGVGLKDFKQEIRGIVKGGN
jgi:hypothetical protein